MVYDPTSIANLAMAHLGDRFITDISDASDLDSITLNENYDHAVGTTYEAHDWKWACQGVELQLLVTAPALRYDYAFALPPNFRRISNLCEDTAMRNTIDEFKIVNRSIHTSKGTACLEFVSDEWDEAIWPSYFAECVGVSLAILCAMRITHDKQTKAGLEDRFQKVTLPYARSIDSTQQPAQQHIVRSEWDKARFGSRRLSNLIR